MTETIGYIEIPSDNDGFVLFCCPLCGEYFKVQADDYSQEDVIEICCPCCGLKSEDYLTDDVLELAMKKTDNFINDLLYKEMKKMEGSFKGGFIRMKPGSKPAKTEEDPVRNGIEAMEMVKYPCCQRMAKVKSLYVLCGSYCPYCGVRND